MTIHERIRRHLEKIKEYDADAAKLKEHEDRVKEERTSARRAFVAQAVTSGRIFPAVAKDLEELLESLDDRKPTVRSYQEGRGWSIRPAGDIVRGIIGALPVGLCHSEAEEGEERRRT